jgi:hypothetical protein
MPNARSCLDGVRILRDGGALVRVESVAGRPDARIIALDRAASASRSGPAKPLAIGELQIDLDRHHDQVGELDLLSSPRRRESLARIERHCTVWYPSRA